MADRAQAIAAVSDFACTVLTEEDLKSEGMGAHLAVGQGSAHPPRLVVLEYAPEGHADDAPIVLVGKGITFDSGGISLKPAAKMHQMKSDMTGAAAVLAAVAAAAREALPRRVIGLLAMAENLPGGSAARPGDVVRGFNGDTIEITNTDAEGRLVLCDALAYAQKRWQPEAVVDIATLTGACAVALGNDLAGLFSTDDVLAERISASGKACGEYFWRLPLWAPYAEKLKSGIADICHTGPREGGAINAALFLKHFVADGVRWAHLDIAGTDWMEEKNPLCPAGATAFGARTLLELLRGGVR
jgi:leucyl aminopeptidase